MLIKDFFLNLSLNKKLIAMMLFVCLIVISTLLFLYSQSENALLTEIESQTAELSKAIQVGIEEVTSKGYTDEMRLHNYLKQLNTKGVKEISIIGNSDEIIESTNPKKVGEKITFKKKERIIRAELGEPVSKEGKVYNVFVPVIAGNEHYGYIHLIINAEDVSSILKEHAIKRIVATSLVFGLGIIIAMVLSWLYTKPIHTLVDGARLVAAGDLTVNFPTDRKDEIGELTQSFNFMVQKLREEHDLEEKLRETEHVASIAQLARDIAHEIRNPLNFISLSIDHLREKYKPQKTDEKENFDGLIKSIKDEIKRLNKLVSDFLDYGKPLKLNLHKVDINSLIDEVLLLIHVKAEKEGIKINYSHEELPLLFLDPELIKTCIFNLVLNAFQAMPSGGDLLINTKVLNNTVFLSFKDTGIGIPKEYLSRIFDTFFTTRSKGLGLGLVITKRVVEEHGGKVEFQSVEGQGTTVTITFPTMK
jgi:signal transduction histidine kinase